MNIINNVSSIKQGDADLLAAVQTCIYVAMTHQQQRYLHEKEASADVVRNRTHPDVTVFL